MRLRQRSGWRIALIVATGFFAMVSIPIALFFLLLGAERVAGLPAPAQLAAMAHLMEQAEADERETLTAALHSKQLSVRVIDNTGVTADLAPLWPDDTTWLARYRTALGDRPFAAYEVPRKLFPDSFYSLLTAAEFRVGLQNGDILVVTSESAAWFTGFGLPIGFPFAVFGAVVGLVSLVLLNREFRPVLRLARAVEDLDPSDPEARVPAIKSGTAEVRRLIGAFTRLQQRVTDLLRARAALVGGIQHDVRTFATRLRLRLERLPDPEDRARAEREIADLVSLMESALLATRTQAGRLDLELIDLADLLGAEVRDRRAEGAEVTLTVRRGAHDAEVLADRLALRRIAANLIDNALRFGSVAHLTLDAAGHTVLFAVEDDGPGIPTDRRAALLEPFTRLEPSRSRATGGAGLGLSIVRSLVDSHDGTLSLETAPSGGLRAVVSLPVYAPVQQERTA